MTTLTERRMMRELIDNDNHVQQWKKVCVMSNFTATDIAGAPTTSALQGATTNSIVHNPFAFEEIESSAAQSAPQSPTTNSIVHNPFAFED
ncbi:streptamidine-related RiPP repeat protein [Rhodococcoides fascians]|nr:streptamidine-related RiPP repeat protein [Rhodococcus fascians]MDJ0409439.1 streptamidine-related RiPP repeat protein [Rhodococcus fascians]